MNDDRATALANALIESDRMEALARYLTSGRVFAKEDAAALSEKWVAAVTACLRDRDESQQRTMEDVGAELSLRELEPPVARVAPMLKKLVEQTEPSASPELKSMIADFVKKRDKPANSGRVAFAAFRRRP